MSKQWEPGEFEARTQELLSQESEQPYQWWYCSFADDAHGGFLGAVILQAHGVVECAIRARSLNANPGGELMAIPIPPENEAILPEQRYRNRLLSLKEVKKCWPDAKPLREWEGSH
jgi:hypothetical protein